MIGSPVLTTLIISLLFICIGITGFSLIKVKHADPVQQQTSPASSASLTNVSITIRCAHPFQSLKCISHGNEIPLDKYDELEYEVELSASELLELTLIAQWPEGTPETAVLVHVFPEGKEDSQHTYWAQQSLTQEVTINLK